MRALRAVTAIGLGCGFLNAVEGTPNDDLATVIYGAMATSEYARTWLASEEAGSGPQVGRGRVGLSGQCAAYPAGTEFTAFFGHNDLEWGRKPTIQQGMQSILDFVKRVGYDGVSWVAPVVRVKRGGLFAILRPEIAGLPSWDPLAIGVSNDGLFLPMAAGPLPIRHTRDWSRFCSPEHAAKQGLDRLVQMGVTPLTANPIVRGPYTKTFVRELVVLRLREDYYLADTDRRPEVETGRLYAVYVFIVPTLEHEMPFRIFVDAETGMPILAQQWFAIPSIAPNSLASSRRGIESGS